MIKGVNLGNWLVLEMWIMKWSWAAPCQWS
jgi:hypothetical protein